MSDLPAATTSLAETIAVIGIVTPVSTLVTAIVRIKLPSTGSPTSFPRETCWHFHTNTRATKKPEKTKYKLKLKVYLNIVQLFPSNYVLNVMALRNSLSIHAFHSIFCIPGILKFHKGKTRGVPGHPDGSQRPIIAEGSLQFSLSSTIAQVTHVYFTVSGPWWTTGIVRHFFFPGWRKGKYKSEGFKKNYRLLQDHCKTTHQGNCDLSNVPIMEKQCLTLNLPRVKTHTETTILQSVGCRSIIVSQYSFFWNSWYDYAKPPKWGRHMGKQ